MTKTMTKTIVALLAILIPFHVAFGFGASRVFGGMITHNKSIRLELLEKTYNCYPPAGSSTFTIAKPVVGPIEYFVPAAKPARAGGAQAGRQSLGTLSGITVIVCTLKVYPFTPTTLKLDMVDIWGTSGGGGGSAPSSAVNLIV